MSDSGEGGGLRGAGRGGSRPRLVWGELGGVERGEGLGQTRSSQTVICRSLGSARPKLLS